MHSTVLHKRSTTPGNTPASSILSAGEIALNIADGKMFIKATDASVKTFLNSGQTPYTLDQSLSSVNYQYGSNSVTEILGGVLGGIGNSVSGAGSTVVNGSDNDIAADYAIIGNGSNNEITVGGDYGAILGGVNNTLSHAESFILGSNISSHLSGFTYVNSLSVLGKIYGDGSELTGIVAQGSDTEVRSLTSNWQNTFTTVQQNSASWDENLSLYLPLSGGTVTGSLSVLSLSSNNLEIANSSGNTTFFVAAGTVGINTEVPNQALTVIGSISATGSATVGSSQTTVLYASNAGKVGVNTESPNKELTVIGSISSTDIIYTDSDVEITNLTKGLILRSPNNTRWRITITDAGTLSATSLA